MLLLPTAPGPPDGEYQKGFGSLIVLGPRVNTGPENVAVRSAVPHPLPKTKPPPFCGVSNTFMNPCQAAVGSTVTSAALAATANRQLPRAKPLTSDFIYLPPFVRPFTALEA